MSDRDDAINMMAHMGATTQWLNKLDTLFALVRDCGVELAAAQPDLKASDDLLAAIHAFRLEFYGDEQGADHVDAVEIDGAPQAISAADAEEILRRLLAEGVHAIPKAGVAALVVTYDPKQVQDALAEQVGRSLSARYVGDEPLVLLDPGASLAIGDLDAETMRKHGWVRKNDG